MKRSKEEIRARIEVALTGCWVWQGGITSRGYGSAFIEGKTRLAHRVSYEVHVGPIPEGLQIDHLCRVRSCVNPDHLEAVTPRVNVRRNVGPTALNAAKTHCIHNHEFTPENTIEHRLGRTCRECKRRADRDRMRRKRATYADTVTEWTEVTDDV